jgi:cardiolipin synthase
MDFDAIWNAVADALTSSPVLALVSALYLLSFLLVCLHVLQRPREASASLLWMFLAWAFPVFGPLVYLAFGVDRVPRKSWRKQTRDREFRREQRAHPAAEAPPYSRDAREFQVAMDSDSLAGQVRRGVDAVCPEYPLLGGNQVELLVAGDEAYPRMLEAIRDARHTIHLQTFIIRTDTISRAFLDLLAEKARTGVTVRMLYDRFGSTGAVLRGFFRRYRRIPNLQIEGWTQANVLKRQFQLNLRNHRKLLVVDGERAFLGGINIHDDHILASARYPIQDYHFDVRGPIVHELQYAFLRDWYFITEESPRRLLTRAAFPPLSAAGAMPIHAIPSGPTEDEKESLPEAVFLLLISARRRILAATPYFVPPPDILRAFTSAALRGVDVRLVVPMANNHVYAGLASRARYETLLDAGVRIYERRPPFLHAKALAVDDTLALVGTANLDVRSLRLNYETNLVVYDAGFAVTIRQAIEREIAASVEILPETWARRPAHQRLLENFCNLLSPTL